MVSKFVSGENVRLLIGVIFLLRSNGNWHPVSMAAPFVVDLCGYRATGHPNTSDSNDDGSVEWGHALFDELGVLPGAPASAQIGQLMESGVATDLSGRRPDLAIGTSRPARDFEQYRHLAVFRDFQRRYKTPQVGIINQVRDLIGGSPDPHVESALEVALEALLYSEVNDGLVTSLLDQMPEESLLKIDVTTSDSYPGGRLMVALSSKWSLRTDRAQDCVSQGAKLSSLRRGHMPHYAVVTMEPRPAMLRLIAAGSGNVDCVYHLALPELRQAAAVIESRRGSGGWAPRRTLERLVEQGRVRDYSDLCSEISLLPARSVS